MNKFSHSKWGSRRRICLGGDNIGNNTDKDDDGDGVSDTKETKNGTDTLKADTDGDGSNDNLDAFPLDASEQLDGDGDGTGNNSDNCLGVANSNQSNVDGDKNGDACDSDDDNDGVADTDDAFPKDATETVDTDGDGIGDNFDAAPLDPTVQKIGSRVPMWMLNMIKNQQTGQTEQTSD